MIVRKICNFSSILLRQTRYASIIHKSPKETFIIAEFYEGKINPGLLNYPVNDKLAELNNFSKSLNLELDKHNNPDLTNLLTFESLYAAKCLTQHPQNSLAKIMKMYEVLGARDLALALSCHAHHMLFRKAVTRFANSEQRQSRYFVSRFLKDNFVSSSQSSSSSQQVPPLIGAFCLHEANSGSDPTSIAVIATPNPDFINNEVSERFFLLNGTKSHVLNGVAANAFLVFANVVDESETSGTPKPLLTAFIVEKDFPGVRVEPSVVGGEHRGHADEFAETSQIAQRVHFENVKIPESHFLGQVGDGFRIAMETINSSRLALASSQLGLLRRVLSQLTQRLIKKSGTTVTQDISDCLADRNADLFAFESALNMMIGLHETDSLLSEYTSDLESAALKIFGSNLLWRLISELLTYDVAFSSTSDASRDDKLELDNLLFAYSTWNALYGSEDLTKMFIVGQSYANLVYRVAELMQQYNTRFHYPVYMWRAITSNRRNYLQAGASSNTTRWRHKDTSIHGGAGGPSDDFVPQRRLIGGDIEGKASAYLDVLERQIRAGIDLPLSQLRNEAESVIFLASELKYVAEDVLSYYPDNIIEKQLAQKRLADSSIELFLSLCSTSRAAKAIEMKESDAELQKDLAKNFSHRINSSVKSRLFELRNYCTNSLDNEVQSAASRLFTENKWPIDDVLTRTW